MGIQGGRKYVICSRQCFEQGGEYAAQDRSFLGYPCDKRLPLSFIKSRNSRDIVGTSQESQESLRPILPCIPGNLGIMFPERIGSGGQLGEAL